MRPARLTTDPPGGTAPPWRDRPTRPGGPVAGRRGPLSRAAGLAALLLAAAAGCAELVELQHDPLGARRPSVLVRRVREEAGVLKDAYRQERRGGYGPIDFLLDEILEGAKAMEEDLLARGGRFIAPLTRARDARGRLDPLMQDRARVSPAVRGQWRSVRSALDDLTTEFNGLGVPGIYEREAAPPRPPGPR